MKKVEKPWGHEIIWANSDRIAGKVLYIKKGHRLSLQYHEKKEEAPEISEHKKHNLVFNTNCKIAML